MDDSLVVVFGTTYVGHDDHGEVLSPDGHVIDDDIDHDNDAAVHRYVDVLHDVDDLDHAARHHVVIHVLNDFIDDLFNNVVYDFVDNVLHDVNDATGFHDSGCNAAATATASGLHVADVVNDLIDAAQFDVVINVINVDDATTDHVLIDRIERPNHANHGANAFVGHHSFRRSGNGRRRIGHVD